LLVGTGTTDVQVMSLEFVRRHFPTRGIDYSAMDVLFSLSLD